MPFTWACYPDRMASFVGQPSVVVRYLMNLLKSRHYTMPEISRVDGYFRLAQSSYFFLKKMNLSKDISVTVLIHMNEDLLLPEVVLVCCYQRSIVKLYITNIGKKSNGIRHRILMLLL